MRPTPADLAVVALAAFAIGILAQRTWTPALPATHVEIHAGGKQVGRYALDRDRTIRVAGAHGETRLLVRPGGARFVYAPCRDHLCVRAGWLSRVGERAACRRNQVSLVMRGAEDRDGAGP